MSKSNGVNPVVDAAAGTITVPQHSYVAITNFEYLGVDDATIESGAGAEPRIYATLEGDICVDGACEGARIPPEECTVVRCILESLVDDVELSMHGDAVGAVELRIALDA